MQVLHDVREYVGHPPVLAMGKFDGVHLGHAKLMDEAVRVAREMGAPCVVLTFDRHPMSLLHPESMPKLLSTDAEKCALIKARGVDAMIVCAFTKELAGIEPETYLRMLCEQLKPVAIACGRNFTFGHKARGNAEMIEHMAEELGYAAQVVELHTVNGRSASSTEIRQRLDAGDVQGAEQMLGRKLHAEN